jgi:hypothetical protein
MLISSVNYLVEPLFLLELVLIVKDVRFLLLVVLASFTCHYCYFFPLSHCFFVVGIYLHDPRCICREAKTKTRKKNDEEYTLDSMFWPILPWKVVTTKLDHMNQPHVVQPYIVPPPSHDLYHQHDEAVYSLWMHFIDFCLATNSRNDFSAPDLPTNHYTKRSRLSIFRTLSLCSPSSASYPPSTSSMVSSSRLMMGPSNMFDDSTFAGERGNNGQQNYLSRNSNHYVGNNGERRLSSSFNNNIDTSYAMMSTAAAATTTSNTSFTTNEEIDDIEVLIGSEKQESAALHRERVPSIQKESHIVTTAAGVSSQSPDSPSSLWQNHKSLLFAAATQL